MKIKGSTILWGLISIGVTIAGMIVDSKLDDSEFQDRFDEAYDNRKAIEQKGE